jgi:hypothetical protein
MTNEEFIKQLNEYMEALIEKYAQEYEAQQTEENEE